MNNELFLEQVINNSLFINSAHIKKWIKEKGLRKAKQQTLSLLRDFDILVDYVVDNKHTARISEEKCSLIFYTLAEFMDFCTLFEKNSIIVDYSRQHIEKERDSMSPKTTLTVVLGRDFADLVGLKIYDNKFAYLELCKKAERKKFINWASCGGRELKSTSIKYLDQKPTTVDIVCGHIVSTGEVRVRGAGGVTVCPHMKIKEVVNDEFIFVIVAAVERGCIPQDTYGFMDRWRDISYHLSVKVLLFNGKVFIKVFNFSKYQYIYNSNYAQPLSECFELTKDGETFVVNKFDTKKFEELWELKDKKPVEVQASKEWSKGDEPVHILKVIKDLFKRKK